MTLAEVAPQPTQTVPQNPEVEQQVLGALLVDNRTYESVSDTLKAEHFYDPLHRHIYQSIARRIEAGHRATPSTLRHELDAHPDAQEMGGGQYLADLATACIAAVDVADHAEVVRDLYQRRMLLDTVEDALTDIRRADGTTPELVERLSGELQAVDELSPSAEAVIPLEHAVQNVAHESIEIAKGKALPNALSFGLTDLDRQVGGLRGGWLMVLAGRPAMGKTAVAMTLADRVAAQDEPVYMASLEMPAEDLAYRRLATATGISVDDQRHGRLDAEQQRQLAQAAIDQQDRPIAIDTQVGATVTGLRTRIRRWRRKHGLSLVIVDYLGLMRAERRHNSEVHAIAEITAGLKQLARELDVPIVLLSQLNRQVEQRDDKRPKLSDLRDSGSIEQDADVVGLLYREYEYIKDAEPDKSKFKNNDGYQSARNDWLEQCNKTRCMLEIGIAKNRQGQTGAVSLYFDPQRQAIDNLAREG